MSAEFLKDFGWNKYMFPERTDIMDSDLNYLLKCEIILDELMKAGIHNWPEFESTMDKVKARLK